MPATSARHTYLHPGYVHDGLYLEAQPGAVVLANGLPLPTDPLAPLGVVEVRLKGVLVASILFHDVPPITGHKFALAIGKTLYFYCNDQSDLTGVSHLTLQSGASLNLSNVGT